MDATHGRGIAMLIGVNLSQNPFKTSFPVRGWKRGDISLWSFLSAIPPEAFLP
ncbi:MAG: hypothetical protein V7L05_11975 [Nostoc sp.]|uniref:hypothetical protein n=1 Tax=Nostoc sp. TaxID=1180 RepID=UPI002FF8D376